MAILQHNEILSLHDAAISTRLTGCRGGLLAGVQPAFAATLPAASGPAEQLLSDLAALNESGTLSDGSVPLFIWLTNAITLAGGQAETSKFQDTLEACFARSKFLSDNDQRHSTTESQAIRLGESSSVTTLTLVDKLESLLLERERFGANDAKVSSLTTKIDQLVQAIMARGRAKPGDQLAGTQLLKPIGNGNFATIWLSKSLDSGELMATKVFHLDKLSAGAMLWRFRRGMKAMVRLTEDKRTTDNIVRIFRCAESTLAFSMDYLRNGSLEGVATRGWTQSKKIEIIISVSRAVECAHRLGVVHRDIKPGNIVMNEKDTPILTDFDIADIKFVTTLSMVSGGLGTPVFAAPEQLENGDSADERSDIYSLGRLLYFLLLERSPGLQIEADPSLANLSRYPPSLTTIVRRATQFDPNKRYGSVRELITALETHQTARAKLKARVGLAARWFRVNALILGAILLIVTGVASIAVSESRKATALQEAIVREQEARLKAEGFQRELAEALEQNKIALRSLRGLESEKGNLLSDIRNTKTMLDDLTRAVNKLPIGSARQIALSDEIQRKTQHLSELEAEQLVVDERIKTAESKLDYAKKEQQVRGTPAIAASSSTSFNDRKPQFGTHHATSPLLRGVATSDTINGGKGLSPTVAAPAN